MRFSNYLACSRRSLSPSPSLSPSLARAPLGGGGDVRRITTHGSPAAAVGWRPDGGSPLPHSLARWAKAATPGGSWRTGARRLPVGVAATEAPLPPPRPSQIQRAGPQQQRRWCYEAAGWRRRRLRRGQPSSDLDRDKLQKIRRSNAVYTETKGSTSAVEWLIRWLMSVAALRTTKIDCKNEIYMVPDLFPNPIGTGARQYAASKSLGLNQNQAFEDRVMMEVK